MVRKRTLLIVSVAILTGWLFLFTYQAALASGDLELWSTGWGVLPFIALMAFIPYLIRKR